MTPPMAPSWALATIAALVVCGCAEHDRAFALLPEPDFDVYVEQIQPILEARCGNPSTCHGVATRPLAIFGRRTLRIDEDDVFRDPSLTERELRMNYDRVRAFAVGPRPALIFKPLAPSAGGSVHRGGSQFESREQRELRAIADWIDGGSR